jgi:hypothetical protein
MVQNLQFFIMRAEIVHLITPRTDLSLLIVKKLRKHLHRLTWKEVGLNPIATKKFLRAAN